MLEHFGFANPLTTTTAENYLLYGLEPGGFFKSVLCNDLRGAIARADVQNRHILADICQTVSQCFPANSHGNTQAYNDWINDVDNRRTTYRERVEKEHTAKMLRSDTKTIQSLY